MNTVKNKKNFKVYEITLDEAKHVGFGVTEKDGHHIICDHCNDDCTVTTFYIPILNHCLCKTCYDEWIKDAVNYPEDKPFENKNSDRFVNIMANYKKHINAKDCKCVECGKQAVAFFPTFDPDIPAHPYCRTCLDEIKFRILMEIFKVNN